MNYQEYGELVSNFVKELEESNAPSMTAQERLIERAKRDARAKHEANLLMKRIESEKAACAAKGQRYEPEPVFDRFSPLTLTIKSG